MYALVDCNNFYASCQRVFEPHLIGKPVVILSNNDGCVIARSNEAKTLGIPMGAPAFKFKKVFEESGIFVYSSNYALYGDMSSRVMNTLSTFSPDVEVYSIDEAFIQLEGFERYDLKEYGLEIRKTVTKNTGIPVSVGIAPTKALAKLANRIAKKFPNRTGGVYVIDSEEKRVKALEWTKIEDVWGIGRKHTKRLIDKGISNALQFTQMPDEWVRKEMSVVGQRLKKELEGIPTLGLEMPKNKQSIATTRSFDKALNSFEEVSERVAAFTASCAEKLRRQDSHCSMVMVFLRTDRFKKELPTYSGGIVVETAFPTNSTIDLNHYAQSGLNKIFKEGYGYKKAGVIVMGLTPDGGTQLSFFNVSNPKHAPLMSVVDRLNGKHGGNIVRFGGQSAGKRWKMKQERLSKSFTTKISDIIVVKA